MKNYEKRKAENMKYLIVLNILVVASPIFSSECLIAHNATERTIYIVYSHEKSPNAIGSNEKIKDRFAVMPDESRELPYTHNNNPSEIELDIVGTLVSGEKMKLSDHKSIVIVESKGTVSVVQNKTVIGQVSV